MPIYRFGIFELASGELRREGFPVRLQAQPAQVLSILLENAGEIVSREALQQKVWADGTQVDFERGLNYCIAQVRAALGDSADSPRFIRTIPKKGYQFIAPVETVVAVAEPAPPRRWIPFAVALAVGVLGVLLAKWVGPPPIIAVCAFANETGDPAFDRIATGFSDALTMDLASLGPKRAQVIGNADILRKPRMEQNLTLIRSQLGADYVIIGQVQKDSTGLRVLAHLLKLPQQTHVIVHRLDVQALERPLESEADFARQAAAKFTSQVTARR